jgi:hypothetical protein
VPSACCQLPTASCLRVSCHPSAHGAAGEAAAVHRVPGRRGWTALSDEEGAPKGLMQPRRRLLTQRTRLPESLLCRIAQLPNHPITQLTTPTLAQLTNRPVGTSSDHRYAARQIRQWPPDESRTELFSSCWAPGDLTFYRHRSGPAPFAELKPSVSHCYHLVYDKDERRTCPRQEYFWQEQADA